MSRAGLPVRGEKPTDYLRRRGWTYDNEHFDEECGVLGRTTGWCAHPAHWVKGALGGHRCAQHAVNDEIDSILLSSPAAGA